LTDEQRDLVRQNNAEALAVIGKYGADDETLSTPESILNHRLRTSNLGLTNPGWMPFTTKWDLRQQYRGERDEDVALLESARMNSVRAQYLLAQRGLLDRSKLKRLQLRAAFGIWELTSIAAMIPFQIPSAASVPWVGRHLATRI